MTEEGLKLHCGQKSVTWKYINNYTSAGGVNLGECTLKLFKIEISSIAFYNY